VVQLLASHSLPSSALLYDQERDLHTTKTWRTFASTITAPDSAHSTADKHMQRPAGQYIYIYIYAGVKTPNACYEIYITYMYGLIIIVVCNGSVIIVLYEQNILRAVV
jgi:hypothetical protein